MPAEHELPVEKLRILVSYNSDSGEIRWLPRSPGMFVSSGRRTADWTCRNFNSRFAGKLALNAATSSGHLAGKIEGVPVLAHRVAFALHFGRWPTNHIDHINGNRADNRIANLRDVPRVINNRNMKRYSTNTSGATGVSRLPGGTWRACLNKQHIGCFLTFGEALAARSQAAAAHGYHPNHGREA